jgi:light-regulated signal transduction histidine kinase (bacteriophytochrome)
MDDTDDTPVTMRHAPLAVFGLSLAGWIAAAAYVVLIRAAAVDALAVLALGLATSGAVWWMVRAGLRARAADAERRVDERTRALQDANRELESFAYSVSHDLRAPLRHVDGFSRMLEQDHAQSLDQDGRRLLATVRKSAERMGRLLDDLLAFSRFGRAAMSPVEIDMTALARAVADELARGTPCTIVIDALPAARADAGLVRQVWVNLVGNAIKYSARRPDPRVEIAGRVEGDRALYCVKDNGTGFDPRYADKLFKVFQRLHGEDDFPGTGVGLAIVQRIVARHGGRVGAEGRPGEGATFWFSLPR